MNASKYLGFSWLLWVLLCSLVVMSMEKSLEEELDPQTELTQAISRLLDEGLYSDFTITCRNCTFPVHETIICTRSSFFSAACNNGFQETSSSQISLDDDDQATVKNMIDYFYKLDYNDGFKSKAGSKGIEAGPKKKESVSSMTDSQVGKSSPRYKTLPPIVNARVYAIADKYDIKSLKALSQKKFNDCIEDYWDHKKFELIIRVVHESTPEGDKALRRIVAETAFRHISTLNDQDEFRQVQRAVPGFTFDLLDLAIEYIDTCVTIIKEYDIKQ